MNKFAREYNLPPTDIFDSPQPAVSKLVLIYFSFYFSQNLFTGFSVLYAARVIHKIIPFHEIILLFFWTKRRKPAKKLKITQSGNLHKNTIDFFKPFKHRIFKEKKTVFSCFNFILKWRYQLLYYLVKTTTPCRLRGENY